MERPHKLLAASVSHVWSREINHRRLMNELLSRLKTALADRYSVQHEIGRGGMATVFLAQDIKHARPVAVKVLAPELGASLAADRFLREIKISAKLQHPHIVPLYDSGVADDLFYYVMPFVDGESLRARLSRQRQIPLEEAVEIAGEVADALDYAHHAGVVHRDIKPENILLSGGHAMVADFGIAFAITTAGGEKLTRTGIAVGTPGYMSPEQASGEAQIDARTDIYGLGCVLYEMLAGLPPYVGPTPMAILAQQAVGKVKPPRKLRSEVPKPVERAVLKALATAPADRHSTAEEFARVLRTPGRGSLKAIKPRFRLRKATLVVAAVLAVVAAGALLMKVQGAVGAARARQAFGEGGELHVLGLATGENRSFEDAIARFSRAAQLDTNFIASAFLQAAWSYAMLGQLAAADSLIEIVEPRRARLSPGELLSLDLIVAGFLRGDRAGALRIARQTGGSIDHGVHAFRYNYPREAIQALEAAGSGWGDYWRFLTASYHILGDHEGELSVARSGRQRDPDRLSRAYYEVRALAALGRVSDVNQLIDEAVTLPPEPDWGGVRGSVMTAAATELRAHGNRAAAVQVAERAIDWLRSRPPEEAATRLNRSRLGTAYRLAERWNEARLVYEQLAQDYPDRIFYQGALGTIAAWLGEREEALRISETLIGKAGPYAFGVEFYFQADIAALLGDRDRAMSLLRDAFAKGFAYSAFNPHADMDLESLRDYEPYQELVRPKG